MDKKITKIVITGGPCAGKTTGLDKIKEVVTEMGYTVVFVPETATELISGGIAPWTMKSNYDYQLCQMKLQIEKEKVFCEATMNMPNAEKILVVCDRGFIDNKAYMTEEEFRHALSELSLDEIQLRDSYDAVFHLVTAANGAEEFYTLCNNSARTETIEQAVELDNKLMSCWIGHPHLRIIDNLTGFDGKMDRLMEEILCFLGEPEPFETERKFLIEYPDVDMLENNPYCKKTEIIQTYITSSSDEEVRIRQRGYMGSYTYYKTTKKKVDNIRRIEIENQITEGEYLLLLMNADITARQIRKTRYCLVYEGQYFEIDIYPFWNDKAIMEIELINENEKISVPEFIKVIKEVTGDDNYRNSRLAKM